jgi:hypothetical protein
MTVTPAQLSASREFMVAAERVRPFYVLSDDFKRLINLIEDPTSDQAAVEAELAAVTRDIQRKAFGIAELIRDRERYIADLKLEEAKLAAKRKVAERLVDRMHEYTLREMHVIGVERIDFGVHTLTIRVNPPSCEVVDAALVPSDYQRTRIEVTVDRRSILEDFKKTGEIPPGVEIRRGERISIE